MAGEPLYRVIGLLEGVKKQGNGYEARCPGSRHQNGDRKPSLSVGIGSDGRVLLRCFAGCPTDEILSRLGLQWGDLFERTSSGDPVRRFRLVDQRGQVVAEHVRVEKSSGKEMYWQSNGKNGLNGTAVVDLPLYRLPDVLSDTSGQPVIVCEGEKSADALADLGLLAVATVTGAAATPSAATLAPLQGREVWLWPDNDEEGRQHMARIALQLHPVPRWVCWDQAPPKGDAADYVEQGGTADGVATLVREAPRPRDLAPPASSNGIRIWTATELANERFKAPKWAIPDLLPAGLAILAGRPKLGKSWLALGWAIDVALGAPVLRQIPTQQGETLYLALEDGPRRMQERIALMLGEAKTPRRLHVATEWPRTNEGGIDLLHEWLSKHPEARLVVMDTFKRVRPVEKNSQRLYDLDYDAIAPVAKLALEHNVAIVPVFHTRKGDSSDPLEMVSGTLGLSGAADAVLVLRRERGQADASLFVTGRDVEEQDLALRWERQDVLGWTLLGDAEQFRRSRERQEVLDTVRTLPGSSPSEIADAIGKSRGSVRKLLFAMARDGEVRTRDGKYFPLVPTTTGNSGNTGNTENSGNARPSRQIPSQNPVTRITSVPTDTAVTAVTALDTEDGGLPF